MCYEQYSKPCKTSFSQDAVDKFLNNMMKKMNIVVKKLK